MAGLFAQGLPNSCRDTSYSGVLPRRSPLTRLGGRCRRESVVREGARQGRHGERARVARAEPQAAGGSAERTPVE